MQFIAALSNVKEKKCINHLVLFVRGVKPFGLCG